jgi:hypothetical protein
VDNQVLADFLSEALMMVATILLPVAIAMLRVWVNNHAQEVRARLSAEQRAELDAVVRIAVSAAEQSGLNAAAKQTYYDKKSEAVKMAGELLASRGVNLPVGELANRIEAMVLAEFNKPAALAAPATGATK